MFLNLLCSGVTMHPFPDPPRNDTGSPADASCPASPLNRLVVDLLTHIEALYDIRAYRTAHVECEHERAKRRKLARLRWVPPGYTTDVDSLDLYTPEKLFRMRSKWGARPTPTPRGS